MANGVEIRIRLYNKEQIEKFNQFISSKTIVGTKNKILSDLLISAIDNEIDDMLTFVMNQLGSLTNDYDTHNNPPKILRTKPEWVNKLAEEISEKLKHFDGIKEYHDVFNKK